MKLNCLLSYLFPIASAASAAAFVQCGAQRYFSPLGFTSPASWRRKHLSIDQLKSPQHSAPSRSSSNNLKDDADNVTPLFPERLNIIYDSKCSVCQWEVDDLVSRMANLPPSADGVPLLRFTDLESPEGYDESDPINGGVTYEDAMRSFHAVKPDGAILHGVPVFREAYNIVDLGLVWAWTANPFLRQVADFGYKTFARIRTDVTRGASVEELIERHYGKRGAGSDAEGDQEECIPCRDKSPIA